MGTLIGRTIEIGALAAVLDSGGAAVLAGPAGIGKSTLARHVLADRPHLEGGGLALLATRRYAALERAVGHPLEGEVESVAERLLRDLVGRILCVEDAHWTDPATAAVLALLVGHAPLLVTVRPAGLAETHRGWFEHPGVRVVELGPLPGRAAQRLARQRHPGLDAQAVRDLVEAARGNPLLIETLAADTRLSPTLTNAVAVRLAGLSGPERDALGRLALRGRPSSAALVGQAAERRLGGLLRWQDGLVEVSHSLIGEAVVELLDPAERRRLHADLADVLDDEEAAGHELEAGRTARAHLRARRAAARTGDSASRAALLVLAARAAAADHRPDRDRHWLDAADALIDAGRWTDALDAASQVHSDAPEVRAETALHRGRALWLAGDVAQARAAFDDGLVMLGETGTELAARLAMERAYLGVRHDLSDRVPVAEAAVAAAERVGWGTSRARATLGAALLYDGRPGWEDLLSRVAGAAFEAGDVELSCTAAYHLSSGLGFTGRLQEGTALAERQAERAAAHGMATWSTHFQTTVLINRALQGGEAERVRDGARAFLEAHPVFRNRFHAHNALILALGDLGLVGEAARQAELARLEARSAEAELFAAIAAAEVAWLRADRPGSVQARDAARSHGETWFGVRIMAEVAALHLAVELDAPFEPRVPSSVLPQFWAGLHDVAGLQAWQAGEPDHALHELDRAVDGWRSVSLSRFAARSAHSGAVLAQRAGRRDAPARRARAADIARRGGHYGMLDRLGASHIDLLTRREESVMRLLAEGRTTSQVAAELGIAPATVATHVQSARRKLGAASRTEAAIRVAARR